MEVQKVQEGLWLWRGPHPDWKPENGKPGGWGQMVASVYCAPRESPARSRSGSRGAGSADTTLLIDPLAPDPGTPESERFWAALDRDVDQAGLPVAVLIGNEYHARSAQAVHDRYLTKVGASIWSSEAARGTLKCRVTNTYTAGSPTPQGVVPCPITSLSEGELAYYLPERRTVIFADAVLGARGGRLRVAPPSWAPQTPEGSARYGKEFRSTLRRLIELPIDRVLVSHGPSVLDEGGRALAEALDSPAWGEDDA